MIIFIQTVYILSEPCIIVATVKIKEAPAMKSFCYYQDIKTPYPVKKDFTTWNVYKGGKCLLIGASAAKVIEALNLDVTSKIQWDNQVPGSWLISERLAKAGYVFEELLDEEAYRAAKDLRNAEEIRLIKEFKQDLYAEFNVQDNPKRGKCFDLAWSYGHSSGLSDVYNHFSDLVELIW